MTVGSLFSGIGGLDLGLERAGMRVIWQSEIDPYACRVLAKHWPDVPNLGDITQIDWSIVDAVDVLCGGYPCQPFSAAGLRRGERDPRHLWPLMLDAIRVLRPRYVLAENVAGHLTLGFDRVLADLASLGLDAEWSVVSACSMGAPHMRRRLFWLAHSSDAGSQGLHDAIGRVDLQSAPITERRRQWGSEPDVARVANGVPGGVVQRIARTRALGNAVVPQVAEHIGRMIVDSLSTPTPTEHT